MRGIVRVPHATSIPVAAISNTTIVARVVRFGVAVEWTVAVVVSQAATVSSTHTAATAAVRFVDVAVEGIPAVGIPSIVSGHVTVEGIPRRGRCGLVVERHDTPEVVIKVKDVSEEAPG